MNKLNDMLLMPASEQLQLRVAQGPDDAHIRGMFLTTALEMVEQHAGVGERRQLVERLLQEEPRMMTKSQLGDFNRIRLEALPLWVAGNLDEAKALASVGQVAVDTFFESVAGRTMKLLAGSDPHRLMTAAPPAYELVVSDGGKRSYTKTSPTSGSFQFSGDWIGPCHHYGVFSASIRQTCGLEVDIDVEQTTLTDFVLHVRWGDSRTG